MLELPCPPGIAETDDGGLAIFTCINCGGLAIFTRMNSERLAIIKRMNSVMRIDWECRALESQR